jgi:hypothetical protein
MAGTVQDHIAPAIAQRGATFGMIEAAKVCKKDYI